MLLLWFPFQVSLGWCLSKISTHTRHVLVLPQLIINSDEDNQEHIFKEWLSSVFHLRVTSFFASRGTTEAQTRLRHPQTSLAEFYVAVNKKTQRAYSGNVLFCHQNLICPSCSNNVTFCFEGMLFPIPYPTLSSCPQLNPSLSSGCMNGNHHLDYADKPSLYPCYSEYGPWVSGFSNTWELIKHAESQGLT